MQGEIFSPTGKLVEGETGIEMLQKGVLKEGEFIFVFNEDKQAYEKFDNSMLEDHLQEKQWDKESQVEEDVDEDELISTRFDVNLEKDDNPIFVVVWNTLKEEGFVRCVGDEIDKMQTSTMQMDFIKDIISEINPISEKIEANFVHQLHAIKNKIEYKQILIAKEE
jgi:hypothetical protein